MKGLMPYYRVLERTPLSLPFISSWNTNNISTGSSAANQIKLPLISTGIYNFIIYWGDGNSDVITVWNQLETTHTYLSAGSYTITITGTIVGWSFAATGDRLKILNISQWGCLDLTGSTQQFRACSNLIIPANDAPIIGNNLALCFRDCTNLTGGPGFNNWDVSSVINFNECFRSCSNFNSNISNWNTSSGTSFLQMFFAATIFNQNIGGWNMSSATNLAEMLRSARAFNQNIGGWNVSNVNNFPQILRDADAFDQNIGGWNISSAINMGLFMTDKPLDSLSRANLDAIYNGWSSLPTPPSGIIISFATLKYTAAGQAGRDILTGIYGWTITDGGI